MEQIGIIGLGLMGSAMAQRMTSQGQAVLGWTRSGRPVDGVKSAQDLESLVESSDTLITSLFGDEAVAEVLDRLLTFDLKGKQIIETSTVMPDILKSRIQRISKAGASAVDAPISGGPDMVLAGSCGVFIGGTDDAAARASASLASLSGRIIHVGPLGTGLIMKVINNGMIQTYFAGLSELMPLAQEAGLPLETALRILCGGPAGMPLITNKIPKVLGEDKEVGFALNTAFKDNDVCMRVLDSFGLDSPVLSCFDKLKDDVAEAGLLDGDPAALINLAYDGRK
ncbi:MAG: NAD(P)-dependent oxidoreductase [Rhizobiaceae bacterium]